ncbi:inaD-like protein isoform X3 [Galleria mellonella]|uniref:InaD-like protein isoform X3 n=1 Tax=Galleria mellonella TaxID=7137 RepID=A0A6J3C368_GALME|nr:inaD-like protein isoform X3 [Galleria mellonella]
MSDPGNLGRKDRSPLGKRKIGSDPGHQGKREVDDSQSDVAATTIPDISLPTDTNSPELATISESDVANIPLPTGAPPEPSAMLASKLPEQLPKGDAKKKEKTPLTKMIEKSIMLQDQTITPGSSLKNLHDNLEDLPKPSTPSTSMPSIMPDEEISLLKAALLLPSTVPPRIVIQSSLPPQLVTSTETEEPDTNLLACDFSETPNLPRSLTIPVIHVEDETTQEKSVASVGPINQSTESINTYSYSLINSDSTDTSVSSDTAEYAPLSPDSGTVENISAQSTTVSSTSAAAKLKHTEGVVKLTVCTPNLKDKKEDAPSAEETGSAATSVPAGSTASHPASGNQTPDPGLTAAGSSRPHSPRPAPSPVRTEPPADPATAPIVPNQETVIEIATNSQNLGLFLLGGSDTSINGPAAVVLDVVKDRPVGRDGRLQHGDQIRAACGISLTDAMTEDRLNMTIKQWAPKLKFTVFRPDPIPYVTIEVDINRKQKPLGFSFAAFSNDKGVYIAQILPGSPTEQDGRLKRGDHILTVDGKDISGMDFTSASIALKLLGPKVSIKVRRLKIVR